MNIVKSIFGHAGYRKKLYMMNTHPIDILFFRQKYKFDSDMHPTQFVATLL